MDIKKSLADICQPIVRELSERVEGLPSEKDTVAINTAITRAAFAGAQLGMREAAAQLIEQLPGIHLNGLDGLNVTPSDLWSERYGPDAP